MIAYQIIEYFYPDDTPLRQLLLRHSTQVRNKAMALAQAMIDRPGTAGTMLDLDIVNNGSLLHDIGIVKCYAPGILCAGTEPYLCHGILGADMLHQWAMANNANLSQYERICARHTGSGISKEDIVAQGLPMPAMDYFPETLEEKIICLADKFYSKSGEGEEKSIDEIRRSFAKFGSAAVARLDALCKEIL